MSKVAVTDFALADVPATVDQLLAALEGHPEYAFLHHQLAPDGHSLFLVVEQRATRRRYMLCYAAASDAVGLWSLIDVEYMHFML